ncbi:MAG: VanZ family protein [Anaerovoracaceae bacterium]|nr:VanZ family protein [Anaerovoracaceae bacterium]
MLTLIIQTFLDGKPLHLSAMAIFVVYMLFRCKKANVYLEPFAVAILLLSLSTVFSATIYSPDLLSFISLDNLSIDKINCDFISFYNNIFLPGFIGDFHALINWLGNIFLFVPVGASSMWLLHTDRKNILRIVIISCFLSILIESIQMSYGRISDIIDVLLNTFGSYIGCITVVYILELAPNLKKKYYGYLTRE